MKAKPVRRSKRVGRLIAGKIHQGNRERTVGPWKLSLAEARALDLACVFERHRESAAYTKLHIKTIEIQLQNAYRQMERHGVIFTGHKKVEAVRLWVEYWFSEAGKANLRNVRLTAPPQP